jgi:hypothetical protein
MAQVIKAIRENITRFYRELFFAGIVMSATD